MGRHIHFCMNCSRYTMAEICRDCNEKTILPRPPKYSPEDKYSGYRRKVKRAGLIDEGRL